MDLVRAESKIRRHNPEGDLLFIKGKSNEEHGEDGHGYVEIAQEVYQQDDELSIFGSGIVRLPRKPAYRIRSISSRVRQSTESFGAATIERVIAPLATS